MIKVIHLEDDPLVVECTESDVRLCSNCRYHGSCNFKSKDARGVMYAFLFSISLFAILIASIIMIWVYVYPRDKSVLTLNQIWFNPLKAGVDFFGTCFVYTVFIDIFQQ